MNFVINELQKSLRYHTRQLADNENEITSKKESIESLENANDRHRLAILEIESHLDELEVKELAK